MEYVRSNRGAFKLIHGNHVYVKQKVLKNGAVCWECEQRRNKVACKAKLHVLNDQIVKNVNEHTHPANRGEVESIKVRQAMKNLSVADIRTAINGSRTSFRTTPTATLCSIFVGLPTTSACEEHFFSCFRLYATPKRLF